MRRRPIVRLFAVVSLGVVCLGDNASGNVFGKDRRVAFDAARSPFRAIGRITLRQPDGRTLESCSGTLVGARLVLTAAHCVGRDGERLDAGRLTLFSVGNGGDEPIYRAVELWSGAWRSENDSRAGDWALLLLDGAPDAIPLDVDGTLPAAGQEIAVLGYSADFENGERLSGETGCRLRALMSDGVYHHDCATYAGASGGPAVRVVALPGMTPRLVVIGVHSAHRSFGSRGLRLPSFTGEYANLVTGAVNFREVLQRARRRAETVMATRASS